jgi:hypothetical protein
MIECAENRPFCVNSGRNELLEVDTRDSDIFHMWTPHKGQDAHTITYLLALLEEKCLLLLHRTMVLIEMGPL